MTMKRVILSLVAVFAVALAGAQVRPQNNHTVSTTLGLGLEYGFEWAFAGQASVIGRIGYASKDFTLRSALDNFHWSTTLAPSVTLEPRYYFLMNWRDAHGKYTAGNSAEFFGVPVTATLRKDGKGLGELAVSPVIGVRTGSMNLPPGRTSCAFPSSSQRRMSATGSDFYSKQQRI